MSKVNKSKRQILILNVKKWMWTESCWCDPNKPCDACPHFNWRACGCFFIVAILC